MVSFILCLAVIPSIVFVLPAILQWYSSRRHAMEAKARSERVELWIATETDVIHNSPTFILH